MLSFFTELDAVFGRISWTMGLVWLAALAASVYLLTGWQQANAARRRFWQRWAIGTVALSALGVVALALNFFQVPGFNIRAWMYVLAVATLAYWGWAAYFYFTKLPSDVAAAARTSRPVRANQRSAQPQARAKVYTDKAAQTNGAAQQPARDPRPAATTTRRESRRDRKRRSR